jgi:Protein of unknown function (DUF3892)
MIEITAVRLEGGSAHEHIAEVLWEGASSSGRASIQALVDWLRAGTENQAGVVNETGRAPVRVVTAINAPAYVRTHADGTWTDDLLALPRF